MSAERCSLDEMVECQGCGLFSPRCDKCPRCGCRVQPARLGPRHDLRDRLDEARRKVAEAEKALAKAEQECTAIARQGHAKDCRYFNGMDMTCTCGFDP